PRARPPERSGATGPRERRRGGSAGAKPPRSSLVKLGPSPTNKRSKTRGIVRAGLIPLGPRAGIRFGFLTRRSDEDHVTVRLAAAVPADPGNPVRTARFTVNFISRLRHELRNVSDCGHICVASA